MKLKQKMFMKVFMKTKNLLDFSGKIRIIGKMKDEFKGKIVSEFIGLKSKMYSFIAVDNEEVKKAKGVNKTVVNKNKT